VSSFSNKVIKYNKPDLDRPPINENRTHDSSLILHIFSECRISFYYENYTSSMENYQKLETKFIRSFCDLVKKENILVFEYG
jgi:hypothetical protein